MSSLRAKITLLVLLMTSSSLGSWAWEIASSDSDHCAKIFSKEGFKGHSFALRDKELVPYLSDLLNWSDVTEISTKVKDSCTLTLSTLPFLRGNEHELSGDMKSFKLEGEDEAFQNGSMLCTCHKVS